MYAVVGCAEEFVVDEEGCRREVNGGVKFLWQQLKGMCV